MKPPKKVKIGPRTYTVKIGGKAWEEEVKDAPGFLYGATAHRNQLLLVRPGLHPFQTRSTLWHEVLHACVNTAGDLVDSIGPVEDKEEFVVSMLETITLGVLRDNPRLVAYITEKV